jgi:protein O-mannosyl-transferase
LQSTGRVKTRNERSVERFIANGDWPVGSVHLRTLGLSLLLLLGTFGTYSSVFDNAFVNFDDGDYLLHTPQIRQGLDWTFFRWAFTTFTQANWHPLTWISYALDYKMFSLKPVGVHFESVFVHAITAVILFLLLQDVTRSCWKSFAVGTLYALHPLNVEGVAWASERKTVLCMFFFVLALWSWSRYVKQRTTGRYLVVVMAFILGLMAKSQIVTFPFILLLWDIWPLGRLNGSRSSRGTSFGELIIEKIPLFVLSAASSVVTYRAQMAGGAMSNLEFVSFGIRLQTAVVAYARYLGKTIWPNQLSVLYPYPISGLPGWQIVAASALLLAISALVFFGRKHRFLVTGWLWFLGTLVPLCGLVQIGHASMADRYACLPLIGLFLMITWGISDLAKVRAVPDSRLAIAAGPIVLLLAVVTYKQVGYWHDSEALWRHALATTKNNFVAHDNLGVVLISESRNEEALQQFREALATQPHDSISNLYIGMYESAHGNHQAAVDHVKTTLKYLGDGNPEVAETAYVQLGTEYRNLHQFQESRQTFEAALRINPADAQAEIGMGLLSERDKDYPQAVRWYSDAMLKQPNPVASLLLANACRENRQPEQSVEAFQKAQSLSEDFQVTVSAADQMLMSIE